MQQPTISRQNLQWQCTQTLHEAKLVNGGEPWSNSGTYLTSNASVAAFGETAFESADRKGTNDITVRENNRNMSGSLWQPCAHICIPFVMNQVANKWQGKHAVHE